MLKSWKALWNLLSGKDLKEFNKKLQEDTPRRDARAAVAMTAPHDPYLSTGCFVTSEDLEREREENRHLHFVEEAKRWHLLPYWWLFPVEQRAEHRKAGRITRRWRGRQ